MSDALRKALTGVNVAAVTPHKREGHEPDFGALLDLLDYLASAGARGVALLGSTGEFLHMSYEDRIRLVNLGAKRSRLPVIAGVAHSTLDGAVELARQAADAGAAALLLMPPYFFRYKQDDVKEFFLRFADGVGDAIILILGEYHAKGLPLFDASLDHGAIPRLEDVQWQRLSREQDHIERK